MNDLITKKRVITHRGLDPDMRNFYKESSLEAFDSHLKRGFAGIEFDPSPTLDGFIVVHDQTLDRLTMNKDKRKIGDLNTAEALRVLSFKNCRMGSLEELFNLIEENSQTMNVLHLKGYLQTPGIISRLTAILSKFPNISEKLLVFDVKKDTAKKLKSKLPALRILPSVAHDFDIQRFGELTGNTLINIDEAIEWRKEGLIDGIWADEWDRLGKDGEKKLYTEKFFEKIKKLGMFSVVVSPELHRTSPGLYGNEIHEDARNFNSIDERVRDVNINGADYFCTDHPDRIASL